MAKDKKDKTADPAKDKTKEKPAAPKYGIAELAEALGAENTAAVRVKLRSANIEKKSGRYGWDTKAEMMEVVDKLKAAAKKAEKTKKDKGE